MLPALLFDTLKNNMPREGDRGRRQVRVDDRASLEWRAKHMLRLKSTLLQTANGFDCVS